MISKGLESCWEASARQSVVRFLTFREIVVSFCLIAVKSVVSALLFLLADLSSGVLLMGFVS
ncbi:hypothetical protein [uncultured Vibrio sp.]|uniref:hypothetical protein n=1 Tax=uncultured Vibrio sp. TaxID=114054 RepID=UPI002AA94795|nr:hypothetical protein [uncultured Vibrio sp.]